MPTILAVDDSSLIRRITAGTLKRAGLTVIEAEDGAEALGLLSKADMVITDLHMPRLDGIGLARANKSNPRPLPLLMLTGEEDQATLALAREAGVDAFLGKPYALDDLLYEVNRALGIQASFPVPALKAELPTLTLKQAVNH